MLSNCELKKSELNPQVSLNHTQLEMCLLLLEEIQQVPCLLRGEFRFNKSEIDFVEEILHLNKPNVDDEIYYINSLKITNYLIKKIRNYLFKPKLY